MEEEINIHMNGGTENLTPSKILQIAEDNVVEKSVIKFINGKDGSVSEEKVPTTSWGLRRPRAQDKLRSLINQFQPSLVFIAEPKINCSASFCNKLNLPGMQNMVIHNSTSNKKGNIWLFWNKKFPTPTVVSMSSQMITVSIGGNLVSGVHAHVNAVQIRYLWSEMEAISDLQLPWLAIGDFNAITTAMEKAGGKPANTINMLEFNTSLDKCELQQSPKSGLEYSWSNCQHGARRILCNLDRAVFNNLWIQKHGGWSYKVEMRITSDHSPLLGGCVACPKTKNVPQKFQKICSSGLGWRVFGNVNVQIKEAEKEVQEATKLSDAHPLNEEFLDKLVEAENNLNSKEVHLTTMLKLKARTKWFKEGSANTRFFHAKLKVRQARNSITELEDANNETVTDQSKVAKILIDYFEDKFKFKEVDIEESLLEVIPKAITEADQAMLDAIPSSEEIKKIIFEMDPESSPGPDGFSGSFYRSCWQVIQDDVVNAVQFCWKRRFIPMGLNSNFLVLLPKIEGARSPKQFRPIGLRNVSFKIFTKIITSRMSSLMHKFISPQQAAYIKGRNIQDQIVLASEMINEMKKKRRGVTWCQWLNTLLESEKVSVMINGGPNGFFSVGRGLRQGEPLSPILFVLMEDVINKNISKLVVEAKKSIQNLMKLLEVYQKNSGQLINKSKSKLFVDGTTAARTMQIKELIQMEVSSLPDKYLGVILQAGRVKISTIWPMVELLQKKLATWKVLSSIPIYSMSAYMCPKTVIKICERIIRNFLWSGDGETRKFKTFSWRKWKNNWQLSSIWPGLKYDWNYLKENIRWCTGNGQKISIWFDSWIGNSPIIENIGFTYYVKAHISMKVSDLLKKGKWDLPDQLKIILSDFTLPEIGIGNDDLIWTGDIKVWNNAKGKSLFIKECWGITACAILRDMWFQKNKMIFEQVKPNIQSFKRRIKRTTLEGGVKIKGHKWSAEIDDQVILFFKLKPRNLKYQYIKPCYWIPPRTGVVMFCCDGASFGNPEAAGFGVVIRDHLCQVLGVISGGIGIATNYIAEVYEIICVVELAVEWQIQEVILNSDSKTVVTEFAGNKMPWFVRMIWNKAIAKIHSLQFRKNFRETNFSADTAAKKGALLAAGQREIYYGRPSFFLSRIELPDIAYYRMC
ncbi:uncharacterized protein LOC113279508 [Papaver somniferum]|uniref:uncharacterized protein LOC113279508 n=1 Tax=Papaver somniferum TaxID=3469 RepID=UPI000E700092|nr:uncharacterized protein LOC113279508 [Papaver somniferum]